MRTKRDCACPRFMMWSFLCVHSCQAAIFTELHGGLLPSIANIWPNIFLLSHQLPITPNPPRKTWIDHLSTLDLPSYVPIHRKMPQTSVYLAKFSSSPSKRSHFGIFFPNPDCDRPDLSNNFRSQATVGTQIHVVGEPLMAGYMLEMKRHFDIQSD